MADVNPEVLDMVVRALQKDPNLRSTELQGRAAEMDSSIAGLSGRQFHARYGLQARKRLAGSSRGKGGRKKAAAKKGARKGRKGAGAKKGAGTRKTARKKTRARKPAARRGGRRKARRTSGAQASSRTADPVRQVLSESYREKRDALEAAMDRAFERSIKSDRLQDVNKLLSSIDRGIRDFEQV